MEFNRGSRWQWRILATTVIALSLGVAGFVSVRSASASARDASNDGGLLAFSKDGDIWTITPDGSSLTRLTTDPALDRAPSWSPDATTSTSTTSTSSTQTALEESSICAPTPRLRMYPNRRFAIQKR